MAFWVESLGPIMFQFSNWRGYQYIYSMTLAFIPMSRKFKIRDQEAVYFATFTAIHGSIPLKLDTCFLFHWLLLTLFTFKVRKGPSIIILLSSRLCDGHAYKLFYHLVLHNRPIRLDMNTWARAIRYGFL
jgi:hypothetical protein